MVCCFRVLDTLSIPIVLNGLTLISKFQKEVENIRFAQMDFGLVEFAMTQYFWLLKPVGFLELISGLDRFQIYMIYLTLNNGIESGN